MDWIFVLVWVVIIAVGIEGGRRGLFSAFTSPRLLEAEEDDATLEDRRFMRLCSAVAKSLSLTRDLASKPADQLLLGHHNQKPLRVQLRHALVSHANQHGLIVEVEGLSRSLRLQGRRKVILAAKESESVQRTAPGSSVGDFDLSDAIALHAIDTTTRAILNAHTRAALIDVAQRAYIEISEGRLTLTARFPLDTPPKPIVACVQDATRLADLLREPLDEEAALLEIMRSDLGEVRVGAWRALQQRKGVSNATLQACYAIAHAPDAPDALRLSAASHQGEAGWPTLRALALSPSTDEAVRVGAIERLSQACPPSYMQPLLVDWLASYTDDHATPLLDAILRAARRCPCEGLLEHLTRLCRRYLMLLCRQRFNEKTICLIFEAISAQPDPDLDVERALLPYLLSAVGERLLCLVKGLQKRGGLETLVTLRASLAEGGLDEAEQETLSFAVSIIRDRLEASGGSAGGPSLSEQRHTTGGLSLSETTPKQS